MLLRLEIIVYELQNPTLKDLLSLTETSQALAMYQFHIYIDIEIRLSFECYLTYIPREVNLSLKQNLAVNS